jgi:hypothetical protein
VDEVFAALAETDALPELPAEETARPLAPADGSHAGKALLGLIAGGYALAAPPRKDNGRRPPR